MKKLLYSAAVLALAFFAGSCQRENLEPVAANGTVTYTVQVPGAIATKADDGVNNVDKLVYEVYRTAGEKVTAFSDADHCLYHREAEVKDGKAEIALELVNDQNFTVLFWAYDSSTNVYDVDDLTNVTVAPTAAANTHETAAFTGVDFVVNCVSEQGGNVTLTRPVAQLNIATTPESLEMDDTDITVYESYVKVYGLSTSFNVAKQEAGDATGDVAYTQAAVLGGTVKVGSKEYPNLAMNYLGFIPTEGANVKVDYLLKTSEGDIDNTIENVPVKPNYRTNIVGNLISGTQDYNVTLDAEWDGVAEEVEVWDGKFLSEPSKNAEGEYEVTKASELAWLAAAVNGTLPATTAVKSTPIDYSKQTYVLTCNIDLGNFPWTPIGFSGDNSGFNGTFDGAGYTISNLYVDLTEERGYKAAGLFGSARYGTIKNLTIENATVKSLDDAGNTSNGIAVLVGSAQFPLTISNVTVKNVVVEGNRRVAGIAGYFAGTIENCTVENATITAIPDLLASGKYDNGDKVGGIIGYANGKVVLTGNTVKNFTIKGYRDAGGVAGYATDAANNISGNTVIDGSVILDRDYDYCEEKGLTAGAVVGYGTPGENTVTNVAVANTDEDVETPQSFAEALANVADGGVVAVSGEISTTSLNAAGKNITIVGTTEDATIDAGNQSDATVTQGNITFKNLTFKFTSAKDHYDCGFDADNGTLTFENCKFEGVTTTDGEFVFNNCQFTNTNKGKYAAWVYNGKTVYNNCTFIGVDRAAKVFNENAYSNLTATYNNCTFKSSTANKTAVEVDVTNNTAVATYVEIINPTVENMGAAEHYAIGEGVCNLETSGKGLGIVTLDGKGYSVANTTAQLQALTNAGKDVTIEVLEDITGDFTYTQNDNENVVIDGKNHKMTGTIKVQAASDHNSTSTMLVIKNLNFTTTDDTRDFINAGASNNYPHLTVSNCTFVGSGADKNVVPVRLKDSKYCVIEDCTASNIHSFINNTAGWNLTIRNCEVTNAGRGISLGTCQGVLVENVKIQASNEKYGIRMDANTYNGPVTIKDCEVSAFIPVVVRNANASDYKLTFDGTNTMTAANTDGYWCAIGASEYEANGSLPTPATGAVTVTLNDAGLSASGVYGASNL